MPQKRQDANMIQEFKIKNFLSFKEEAVLNFEATKDTTFEDYQVVEVAKGVRLLRMALIYGANASGKSNILQAITFLREFWLSDPQSMKEPTGVTPFLLDKETPDEPSHFELRFYVDGIRYWYVLTLDSKVVHTEKLYFYKSAQPTLLLSRTLEDGRSVLKFNPAINKVGSAALEEITLKCLPNMSFFAARNKVNISLSEIDTAMNWLEGKILPYIGPQSDMFEYAGRRIANNAPLRDYLLDFVHHADFNISDIRSNKSEEALPPQAIQMFVEDVSIPESVREHIKEHGSVPTLRTEFQHKVKNIRGEEVYYLPQSLQSEGTKRTLGIEAAVYEAEKENAVLCIDELEASLHPDLVEYVIEQFLKSKNQSQLLVTTHYDPLLNTINDLIRKDCVWFTEKDEAGNTSLYSLTEFNGLNKISSFQRSYRNGVFGALPQIN